MSVSARLKRRRERLWKESPLCRNCGVETVPPGPDVDPRLPTMATIEHLDSRSSGQRGSFGGTKNPRTTLWCKRCNNERGTPKKRVVAAKALEAVASVEYWSAEVARLTAAIGETVCPGESPPEAETHWSGSPSHFSEVSSEEIGGGQPDDGPVRRNLASVAADPRVLGCPECSALCSLIADRRHAKGRLAVARRLVRSAGKAALAAGVEPRR